MTHHRMVEMGKQIGLKSRIHFQGFELDLFSGSQQQTTSQYRTSNTPGVRMAPMVDQAQFGLPPWKSLTTVTMRRANLMKGITTSKNRTRNWSHLIFSIILSSNNPSLCNATTTSTFSTGSCGSQNFVY